MAPQDTSELSTVMPTTTASSTPTDRPASALRTIIPRIAQPTAMPADHSDTWARSPACTPGSASATVTT